MRLRVLLKWWNPAMLTVTTGPSVPSAPRSWYLPARAASTETATATTPTATNNNNIIIIIIDNNNKNNNNNRNNHNNNDDDHGFECTPARECALEG